MAQARRVRTISGYGAGLRRQLEVAQLSQDALADLAGVSRQTIARAINQNEVTDRTAEQIAAALAQATTGVRPVRSGVKTARDTSPDATSSVLGKGADRWTRRARSDALADASDLTAWSDRRDAQDTLPELVRKLVLTTTPQATEVEFRAGEGVALPGWDGRVTTPQGNAFVPTGASVWELGVSQDPKRKADSDYAKRVADPGGVDPGNTIYVFVTSRRWPDKHEWSAARRAESVWRNVRALDADDLEAWLGTALPVHLWLSGRLGAFPEEALDLETACDQWTSATEPVLPDAFLLAGRQELTKSIRAWLEHPTHALAIRAESRDEVVGVLGAVIRSLPTSQAQALFARAVVVSEAGAWRRLAASPNPLILLPLFEAGELVAAATRAGHAVILPLEESDPSTEEALQVPRIARREAAAALSAVLGDAQRRMADEYAVLGRRSIKALRRQIALHPSAQYPSWSKPESGRTVLPALLAGSWNDTFSGDKQVISTLSRAPYEEARDRLLRWSDEADPPLRRRNSAFYLTSRGDAWTLLSRYLTREDLERFETVVLSVLGAQDPQYDLPPDRRWMSGVLSERPTHSPMLRRGLAGTLAIMGARGDVGAPGSTPRDVATHVVRRLLESANVDWKLWASLHEVLPDLAEAAPDAFLDAVEAGVTGTAPIIRDVFTDRDDHPFGSSPHVGLVWAFERLAWSPEHLGRVTMVLAKLAEVDPGGRYSNRPAETLAAIYRPWMPQTAATVDQRFRILDRLATRMPSVAWPLLASMLPQLHGIGMYGSKPEWREWAPDLERKVPRAEYARAVREVVALMLREVGTDGTRWPALIDAMPMLASDDRDLILTRLHDLDTTRLSAADRASIWNALRMLVANHRSFQDAEWAMAPEAVDQLDAIVARFEPADPVPRYGWLFGYHPELPEGRPADEGEGAWQAYRALVDQKRRAAVADVYALSGLDGLLAIARVAEELGTVGALAAEIPALRDDELSILHAYLASTDGHLAAFARGFAFRRVEQTGPAWVTDTLTRTPGTGAWSPLQRAMLLSVLPPTPDTWRLVANEGPEVERAYWQRLWVFSVGPADTEAAARQLVAVGRPNTALSLLAHRVATMRGSAVTEQVRDPALAIEVLTQALVDESEDAKLYDAPSSSLPFHVSQLLGALSRHSEVDEQLLARLEWRYLPVVGRYDRRPKLLERMLARDPAFFVEVVSYVYRGEGDEVGEVTEEQRQRASRGYSLLKAWRTVPGSTAAIASGGANTRGHDSGDDDDPPADRADGPVNASALHQWVATARSSLAEIGREVIGDQLIGQVLSASPYDSDGTWPARPIRDLIEDLSSVELERGFIVGLYNSRGVTTRDPADGGTLERGLAERYDGLTAVVADQWPRTGALLRTIAEEYRRDALREDHDAALGEDLGF